MHAETQKVHVPDYQAGDEGTQVPTTAGRIDREKPGGDDEEDRDNRRLAPDADSPGRDRERKGDAERDAESTRYRKVNEELAQRSDKRAVPSDDEGGQRERENRSDGIVEGRLGDDRLADLRAQSEAIEQRE